MREGGGLTFSESRCIATHIMTCLENLTRLETLRCMRRK